MILCLERPDLRAHFTALASARRARQPCGFLACSYVNSPGGTNKTGDAVACMTPCLTHAEILGAMMKEGSVSQLGMELGLREGMNGAAALQLIR